MSLAADYPLLEVLWTIALIALWVLWIFTVVWTLVDNFSREDHGGWAKAGWTVFIIIVPLLGVLAYLIVRPTDSAWGGGGGYAYGGASSDPVDTLERLTALRDKGALTEAEFEAQKAKLFQ